MNLKNDSTITPGIPKSVLKCESYLRKVYPKFYGKISNFRNIGHISELEYEKIKAQAEIQGILFEEIIFALHPFLGITESPVDPEPTEKKPRYSLGDTYHHYKRYSRRTSISMDR